jgi:hypothetical protein
MAEIGTMVEQLAGYRIEDGVIHPPLLKSLRTAVWGNVGQMAFKARSSGSIPISADAFILWTNLTNEISRLYSQWTGVDPTTSTSTSVNLLAWHTAYHAAVDRGEVEPAQTAVVTARLTDWVARVTAFFDAPPIVELDIACPHCGQLRATWHSKELECDIESAAIAVTFTAEGMSAVCRTPGCKDLDGEKTQWDGPTQITYMARRMGIDVDQLADKIREAMMPTAVPEYVADGGKQVVTPEDPDYLHEVAVALGEAS